jgi:hypothetical protein
MDVNRESETCVKFILRDSSTCTVPLECIPPDSLFAVLVRARQLTENDISDVLEVPVDSVDESDAHSILCALYANYLIDKHVHAVTRDVRLYTGVSSTLLSSQYRRARAREVLRRGLQRWSLKRLFRGRSYKPLPHQLIYSKLLVLHATVDFSMFSPSDIVIELPKLPRMFAISRILPILDPSNLREMTLTLTRHDTSPLPRRAPQSMGLHFCYPFVNGLLPQLLPIETEECTLQLCCKLFHRSELPEVVPVLLLTHTENVDRPMKHLRTMCEGFWGDGDVDLVYDPKSQKLRVSRSKYSFQTIPFNARLRGYIDFCLSQPPEAW